MSRNKKLVLLSAFVTCLLSVDAAAAGRDGFSSYEQYLKSAVASAGLPEKVAYMPLVLTGGDPVYREGSAAGIWSVTAPIARHYGIAVSDGFDGRYDVEYCTSAALAYFSELYRRSGGDLTAAMSQYALASGQASKSENFFALLSEACERYEQKRAGNKPETVSVTLEAPVQLSDLCNVLDIRISQLQADNPAIIPGGSCLPADAKLRLSEEKAELFIRVSGNLYKSAESALQNVKTPVDGQPKTVEASVQTKNNNVSKHFVSYKVKAGDTLGGIAGRYHVKVSQLKKWNNLKSDSIRAGRILKIYK